MGFKVSVGAALGLLEGESVGAGLGLLVGAYDGATEGVVVGLVLGRTVGDLVGLYVVEGAGLMVILGMGDGVGFLVDAGEEPDCCGGVGERFGGITVNSLSIRLLRCSMRITVVIATKRPTVQKHAPTIRR